MFEHFALQTDPVTEFIKLEYGLFKKGALFEWGRAEFYELSYWICL
jgi:hypothetical protein